MRLSAQWAQCWNGSGVRAIAPGRSGAWLHGQRRGGRTGTAYRAVGGTGNAGRHGDTWRQAAAGPGAS